MIWTTNEINALRAQEAKELAIELQDRLLAKESAPITAGEVQLRELEYELKLKEAEAEDAREQERHHQRIKELELQIQQERARQAEAVAKAAKVREEQAELAENVTTAKESLSVQLEKATRENNLKIEKLEANYKEKTEILNKQREELEENRNKLRDEITDLASLKETAEEIKLLRDEIESRRAANQHEFVRLEEEFRTVEFEKVQKINAVKRQQEIEVSELETQHKKDVMQANQQAAKDILIKIGMMPVKKKEWEKMKAELDEQKTRSEQETQELRDKARDQFLKDFNITVKDPMDVTDLFYKKESLTSEVDGLRAAAEKFESEIKRMRQHIEQEPSRISAAVEAAKVHVSNNIEQSGKR